VKRIGSSHHTFKSVMRTRFQGKTQKAGEKSAGSTDGRLEGDSVIWARCSSGMSLQSRAIKDVGRDCQSTGCDATHGWGADISQNRLRKLHEQRLLSIRIFIALDRLRCMSRQSSARAETRGCVGTYSGISRKRGYERAAVRSDGEISERNDNCQVERRFG
jgi:hypothetical protein